MNHQRLRSLVFLLVPVLTLSLATEVFAQGVTTTWSVAPGQATAIVVNNIGAANYLIDNDGPDRIKVEVRDRNGDRVGVGFIRPGNGTEFGVPNGGTLWILDSRPNPGAGAEGDWRRT